MIWTSLKLVVVLDCVCCAMNMDTDRKNVPNTLNLHVVEATEGDQEEDEEDVEGGRDRRQYAWPMFFTKFMSELFRCMSELCLNNFALCLKL